MWLIATAGFSASPELPSVEAEFPFPVYSQTVRVVCPTRSDAEKVRLRIEPLYDGYQRAVSSRWDDNLFESNFEMKKHLEDYGMKGTFYLNSNDIFYLKGQDYRPTARDLIEGEHSIGGHGLSHPYLSYVNRNRMFQETAGVRIEWESAVDDPMHSYAFSFINFRNPLEGDLVQRNIINTLERAGLYHLAVFKTFDDHLPSDLELSIIMPPENADLETFKKAVDWAYGSEELRTRFPNISLSMHAWYHTPALQYGWDELDRRLAYLNKFPELWKCNQNEYAAYWRSSQMARVEDLETEGNSRSFRIMRPRLNELNDPIPLTLSIEGLEEGLPISVKCHTANVSESTRTFSGKRMFHLFHDWDQRMPTQIGWVDNSLNTAEIEEVTPDADFPDLQAILTFQGEKIRLSVHNQTDQALNDIEVIYRLPIGWKEGIVRKRFESIPAGETLEDAWIPTSATDDLKYHSDTAFFVAQIDFNLGEEPCRLYATCSFQESKSDHFPRDGFAYLGPIEPSILERQYFDNWIRNSDWTANEWTLPGGHAFRWQKEIAGPVPVEHLDPEVIPTQRDWY
ncbi:MAG: polysaccharide deacetylase family protein, partial [Candidatus Omnitrophica bacterium]|nr:polysaccharide deacetylase family protein [Candidatus Omnitrophota bacterium]